MSQRSPEFSQEHLALCVLNNLGAIQHSTNRDLTKQELRTWNMAMGVLHDALYREPKPQRLATPIIPETGPI